VTEHGILFSAPMVRAILEGRKTQTRRVLNPMHISVTGELLRWPYGDRGDRLWVRETWRVGSDNRVHYRADEPDGGGPWRPSIFMPRGASRITLVVTDVRPERLQDISEGDAEREGVDGPSCSDEAYGWYPSGSFRDLWISLNGKRPGCSWADNPWVWVLTFERVELNRAREQALIEVQR
jgi:hypothetical protein